MQPKCSKMHRFVYRFSKFSRGCHTPKAVFRSRSWVITCIILACSRRSHKTIFIFYTLLYVLYTTAWHTVLHTTPVHVCPFYIVSASLTFYISISLSLTLYHARAVPCFYSDATPLSSARQSQSGPPLVPVLSPHSYVTSVRNRVTLRTPSLDRIIYLLPYLLLRPPQHGFWPCTGRKRPAACGIVDIRWNDARIELPITNHLTSSTYTCNSYVIW